MNTFLLYLIFQLDCFQGIIVGLTFISWISMLFYVVYFLSENMSYKKKYYPESYLSVVKTGKRILLAIILSTTLCIFIPDTKSALTLYAADYMTHNKKITKLTHDSLDLIANWVEKQKEKK